MSHEASRWAWHLDLPMRDKFVLLALADWADDDGLCFPSKGKLQRKCGALSVGSVTRALRQLVEWGMIERTANYASNGRQTTNVYRLRLDRSAPVAVAEATRKDAEAEEGITETPSPSDDAESFETSIDSRESTGEGVQADSLPGSHGSDSLGGVTADSPMTRHNYPESPPLPPEPASLSVQAIAAVARVEAEGSPERGTREGFWQLERLYQQANWTGFIGKTDRAIKRWDKLTPDERIAAIAKFPGYVRGQKALFRAWQEADPSSRSRKPTPATLEEYLGNRVFRDLPAPVEDPGLPKMAKASPAWCEAVARSKRSQFDADRVFVQHGTEAFAAWVRAVRRAGAGVVSFRDYRFESAEEGSFTRRGAFFASEWPPAEADFEEHQNERKGAA